MPSKKYVVVGLGGSGLSAVHFLSKNGHRVAVTDTNPSPALANQLPPDVSCHFGAIDKELLLSADYIVISPGIDPRIEAVAAAKAFGISVISDVQLFIDALKNHRQHGHDIPIIAITGSNAKSTVTTLVGEMAKTAGISVGVGGNIGTPALKLLDIDNLALVVLELSSFQLEHISQLSARAATILNLSADHLDRHDDMDDYLAQKLRIFEDCQTAVICHDDANLAQQCQQAIATLSTNAAIISTDSSFVANTADFYLYDDGQGLALYHHNTRLIATDELKIKGKHNLLNALSALALGTAAGLPMPAMLQALRDFKGLPHRCEYVDNVAGKAYFNDSKGTNIGSTLAAIDGLGAVYGEQSLALILGGLGKGQNFGELAEFINRWVCQVYLIGKDALLIKQDLLAVDDGLANRLHHVDTLDKAVAQASSSNAQAVLLSPACASMDQFNNYSHRGEVFIQLVATLKSKTTDGVV